MKKLFKYKSLSTRLCVIVCLITTMFIVAVALYVFVLKDNEEILDRKRDVSLRLSNTVLTIEKRMSHLQGNMTGNAWMVDKYVTSQQRDSVETVLLQLIQICHDISGCGVAFDVDEQAGSAPYIKYAALGADVHDVPLAQESITDDSPDYAWLCRVLSLGRPCWCSPHPSPNDPATTVYTYALPVNPRNDTRRVVFFADVPQDLFDKLIVNNLGGAILRTIMIDDDGQCIFFDDNGSGLPRNAMLRQSDINSLMANVTEMGEDHTGQFDYEIDRTVRPVFYSVVNNAGWTMFYLADISSWNLSSETVPVLLIFVLTVILLYMVLSLAIRKATRPLSLFSDSAIEISKGNFHAELPTVDTDDEMAVLRTSFGKMQQSLTRYMHELEDSTRSQAFIMSELQIASRIQDDLLPKVFPPFPGRDDINIRAALIPARQIGGDLYNYFMRDGKVFFIIADVSGKSVPAAIVMAIACNVFNTVAAHSDDVSQIMEELNAVTCANNAHSGFFITALVGILDLATGELSLCNAGHDPAVMISPDGELTMLKITPNLPAGVMAGNRYESEQVRLAPGTRIFMYTDGITDAENSEHQFYGIDRLRQCLASNAQVPIARLVDTVVADLHDFTGDRDQTDDLTMMVIDYTPSDVKMPDPMTFSNDVRQLNMISAFADRIAQALDLQPSAVTRLNLVLEEICSNIIKYAFNSWLPDALTLYTSVHQGCLHLIVGDSGKPFDPTAVTDADVTAPLEQRPVGGLGITLVRRYTRDMRYVRVNNRNYLTLVFDIDALNKPITNNL